MTPQEPASPPNPTSLGGAQLLARSYGLAAYFESTPNDSDAHLEAMGWAPNAHVANIWEHPWFQQHQVYVDHDRCGIWVLQRFITAPKINAVRAAARCFLDREAVIKELIICPTRIWVPLSSAETIVLPAGYLGCHIVSEFEAIAFSDRPPGYQIRVVASRHGQHTARLWAEVVVGGHLTTRHGLPRRYMYLGDIRRLTHLREGEAPYFLADMFRHLVEVLRLYRQVYGLGIGPRSTSSHPRLGLAINPAVGRTAIDFALPSVGGEERYVVLDAPGYLHRVGGDADRDRALDAWLRRPATSDVARCL